MRIATRFLFVAVFAGVLAGCGRAHEESPQSAHGEQIYAANCSTCHGQGGGGAIGPELIGERSHKNLAQTVDWIKHPLPPMPELYPSPLSNDDVAQVATYVTSL